MHIPTIARETKLKVPATAEVSSRKFFCSTFVGSALLDGSKVYVLNADGPASFVISPVRITAVKSLVVGRTLDASRTEGDDPDVTGSVEGEDEGPTEGVGDWDGPGRTVGGGLGGGVGVGTGEEGGTLEDVGLGDKELDKVGKEGSSCRA